MADGKRLDEMLADESYDAWRERGDQLQEEYERYGLLDGPDEPEVKRLKNAPVTPAPRELIDDDVLFEEVDL